MPHWLKKADFGQLYPCSRAEQAVCVRGPGESRCGWGQVESGVDPESIGLALCLWRGGRRVGAGGQVGCGERMGGW